MYRRRVYLGAHDGLGNNPKNSSTPRGASIHSAQKLTRAQYPVSIRHNSWRNGGQFQVPSTRREMEGISLP